VVNGKRIGLFGEMAPKCITDYELTHPVMMMEMDLSDLIAERSGRLF
jgi:phenylalanyl-tRNA synthetase beta chain